MAGQEANISCAINSPHLEALMVVMAEEVLILFFAEVKTYGRYYTFVILKMFWQMTERMAVKIIVRGVMARTLLLKFPWELLQKMKKQERPKQKFWKTVRK